MSVLIVLLVGGVRSTSGQPKYELIDLGTLGGNDARAFGMNQIGVVAGEAELAPGGMRPVLWDENGVVVDLGVPPGFTTGDAQAVNHLSQVAVTGSKDPQALGAFLWENGVWTELPVLEGRSEAIAEDINGAGQIVGRSLTLGASDSRGVLWEDGAATDLGTLGGLGGPTAAFAINEVGQVVGYSITNPDGGVLSSATRAFIWQNDAMADLGVLAGEVESAAFGLNDSGDVVGESWHLTTGHLLQASQATLWRSGGEIVDLGLTPAGLPGPCVSDIPYWTSNTALAVNNNGQVVGYARCVASGGPRAAFLWQDGVNYNLNDLIPPGSGLNLIRAEDINDAGQIVGVAVGDNSLRAFLLNLVIPCTSDSDCDDGLFCNGAEACVNGTCQAGDDPCPGHQDCDDVADACVPLTCDNDGICELGEDCTSCPDDCVSGGGGAPFCGDGICQPGSGEDCMNCASDCRGKQNGNPDGRFCCGLDVDCTDGRCYQDSWTCDDSPQVAYCCGDASCDPGEDQCNCRIDCGSPPATERICFDGEDNDCDGLTDGADPDCPCGAKNAACTTGSECCSGDCKKNGTCR